MASFLSSVGAQDLTATSTTPNQTVGQRAIASDGTYQYVKASAAIAQYAWVKISADYTAAELTTTTATGTEPGKIGCAQVAIASGSYGWVFVGPGTFTAKFAASCVQDVKIYTTGTAGVADDTATTLIQGAKLITTIVGAASSPAWAACEMKVNCL